MGKVWLVPVGDDGEPMAVDMTGVSEFSWEEGWGDDPGLHGGLEGGPEGALGESDLLMSRGSGQVWSLEFSLEKGDGSGDEVMALLWGMTLAEYRDFRLWISEREWLGLMTDGVWGLT